MIPSEMLKLAAEKGVESTALNPKGGDIPTFDDKIFKEGGLDVPYHEKDYEIPTFAEDDADTLDGQDLETCPEKDYENPKFSEDDAGFHIDADENGQRMDGDVFLPENPRFERSFLMSDIGFQSRYVNAEGLAKYLPKSDGTWSGAEGNSVWIPDPDYIPQKGNPEGKTWGELLDKYGIDGIPFRDGEPDFSEVAEAEVQVDEIGTERDENFAKADEALAKKWTEEQKDGHEWTAEDVRNYRKEHHLTWHECGDRTTMQLVPAEVHSNVPHSGGVSAAKAESGGAAAAEQTRTDAFASDAAGASNNAKNV